MLLEGSDEIAEYKKQIILSFLQKMRKECKKMYEPKSKTVKDCADCRISKCLWDFMPFALCEDEQLTAFIEKVEEGEMAELTKKRPLDIINDKVLEGLKRVQFEEAMNGDPDDKIKKIAEAIKIVKKAGKE